MYEISLQIYLKNNEIPIESKHKIQVESNEEFDQRVSEILTLISTKGYLNDEDPAKWYFIPTSNIQCVELKIDPPFEEIKENETSDEGTNDSGSDQDSET